MAATLSLPSELGHWERKPSSQHSQPQSEHRRSRRSRKRSPNRVKAKPANPAVISGILDSLGTLTSPYTSTSDEDAYFDKQSGHSQPRSTEGRINSLPSLAPSVSPGFYGSDDWNRDEDEDEVSDAALPPTVRLSRPPSGLSLYNAPRTPSFTGASSTHVHTPSMQSRRSSFSSAGEERTSYSRNKLSAESWVKHNSSSRESIETPKSRNTRSLQRMSSQDSVDYRGTRVESVARVDERAESPNISRAEQIIAKASTPPLSISKRRLYLTDSGSNEAQSPLESPATIEEVPESEESPQTSVSRQILRAGKRPFRTSPQESAILDSIPTRTSSLRQTSGSPASGRKKERKSKRKSEAADNEKVDSVMDSTPKSIPESSWADLGEQDETVRRIRELQGQRKSRLLESRSYTVQRESPALDEEATPPPVVTSVPAPSTEENKRASRLRPGANRASTEPPSKAHKILGITDDRPLSALSGTATNGDAFAALEFMRRRNLSLDNKNGLVRPATNTSSSPTPPLSLDYSYAEAVDVLHGVERELRREKQQKTKQFSEKSPEPLSVQIPRIELVPKHTPHSADSSPVRQRSTKSKRKPQERHTLHHPDLPLDFDKKKNRRKSLSDARYARQFDDETEHPLPRKNSIEVAVSDFLHDARLSRRISHPLTGRVIAFSEVGDPNGAAVFVCVGMGLTRYVTAFYDELATTLRLRLITVDRPGVGGSEPYSSTDRSGPLSWPDDILAICRYLGISKFSMLAHSAGAVYALATALVLPHLIQGKIHLLGPWIPPSQLEAISHSTASAPPAGALPRSQRLLRVLPTPFLKAANSSFITATSASLKPASKRKSAGDRSDIRQRDTNKPPSRGRDRPATRDGGVSGASPTTEFNRRESMMLMDQYMPALNSMDNFPITVDDNTRLGRSPSFVMSATATPMDPSFEYAASALNAAEHTEKERKTEYTSRLTQLTWELAVRDSNPATDLLVCLERNREVGFKYTDVHRKVVITHGSEDKRVPVANVKWLAEQMNRHGVNGNYIPPTRDGHDRDVHARGGCEVRILQGEGHGLMASPVIMGDILTEIAGYWNKGRSAV